VRLTDDDRRRLAARAYRVGRRALRDIATPDTLLRWHRPLIAPKSTCGRPSVDRRQVVAEIRRLVVRMFVEHLSSRTDHPGLDNELITGKPVANPAASVGVRAWEDC